MVQGRQQWQRARSVPSPPNSPERPPIPVSTTTKSKLKAFHFQAPNAKSAKALDHGPGPARLAAFPVADGAATAGPEAAGKENRPLAEANAHDMDFKAHETEGIDGKHSYGVASLNDRISWENPELQKRRFIDFAALPSSHRRKRARSSSPRSSSPVSNRQPATLAVDVKMLAHVLKTPCADPSLELWDRFSLASARNTSPSGPANPLLAHLIASSSPRPARGDAEVLPATSQRGSLRKAISCGSHWPKRRRIDRVAGMELNSPASAASRESPIPSTKASMVSALLRTVDGEIRKSKLAQALKNTSAPPSPRKPPCRSPCVSPLQKRLARGQLSHLSPSREGPAAAPTGPLVGDANTMCAEVDNPPAQALSPLISDFGSCDFDDETLLEIDASINLLQREDDALVVSPSLTLARSGRAASAAPTFPTAAALESAQTTVLPLIEDDFGDFDDDDDIFEGAEALVAEIESKHPSQKPLLAPKTSDGPLQDVCKDECDEFDLVDLDDFDIDAAELAATQSFSFRKSAGPAPSNVCFMRNIMS